MPDVGPQGGVWGEDEKGIGGCSERARAPHVGGAGIAPLSCVPK